MSGRPIVGILGGMGPEATADLFLKILRATPARRDQDHLHIVIDNRSQVPDRTAAIFGEGNDPRPELVEGINLLTGVGCVLIAVPCNTAHYFHDAMQEAAGDVPVLHMMRETADYIRRLEPPVRRIGLLATTGTVQSRLYHNALESIGMEVIAPDAPGQERVMEAIYDPETGIKVGLYDRPRVLLREEAARLVSHGAQALIAGCTELPLALHQEEVDVPYVDATRVLAESVVKRIVGHTTGVNA